ncbi:MFS transporter [Paraburkholderia sp. GAS334]|uniref:MFS transporter n=1 Tax=Paraburkholderia sp. GAS334 TaxID=3035131 RepID=UPI003D1CCC0A
MSTTMTPDSAAPSPESSPRMPIQVWLLTLCAFAVGTAEFVIAGLITQISSSLHVTEGQAGYLIIAFAVAVVFGGPPLTIFLARFEKKRVLLFLMLLFIAGNLISATATDFSVVLGARVLVGLVQGPFYGIGAVVATSLVRPEHAGRALGQMFAGLTLASVLGVPAGTWIGTHFGWSTTLYAVAGLGVVALVGVQLLLKTMKIDEDRMSVRLQLAAFRNPQLIASVAFTVLAWTGFMACYGYIAPVGELVAGYSREGTVILMIIVGFGMLVGNRIGGQSADRNLSATLIFWPFAMILSLLLLGAVVHSFWAFTAASFIFGIASFANVSPMQMRVMKYGQGAPELSATVNISAFNLANCLGGFIGGKVIDSSHLGAAFVPYAGIGVSLIGLILIVSLEWRAFRRGVTKQGPQSA